MKYLLILLLSFPAFADMKKCTSIEKLAKSIMTNRQSDVPLSKMVTATTPKWSRALIMDAYKEPLWATDKNKLIAINKFANDYYMICLKSIN